MKNVFFTLLLLFISSISFAQGIAVQGIARDNTSSAITDANLTFTFSITENDNTVLYAETQSIKTDRFGVFSHIVKNGNPLSSTVFSAIDFSIQNLKMKVSVKYNNTDIEVYNQTFQYTPYAHFAENAANAVNAANAENAENAANAVNAANGVPTGAIMPFIGAVAPTGWALCDGNPLPTSATKLIAMVGTRAPDLRGMFLRGTSFSQNSNLRPGADLMGIQSDGNKSHRHAPGSYKTEERGLHNHNNGAYTFVLRRTVGNNTTPQGFDTTPGEIDLESYQSLVVAGNHDHAVTQGFSDWSGDSETRPYNYGVNYIIKL
ncbi:MAG: hypothetical protein ACI9Q3_000537 [Maribacter sp.]|jgi:hypothetical protein